MWLKQKRREVWESRGPRPRATSVGFQLLGINTTYITLTFDVHLLCWVVLPKERAIKFYSSCHCHCFPWCSHTSVYTRPFWHLQGLKYLKCGIYFRTPPLINPLMLQAYQQTLTLLGIDWNLAVKFYLFLWLSFVLLLCRCWSNKSLITAAYLLFLGHAELKAIVESIVPVSWEPEFHRRERSCHSDKPCSYSHPT